MDVFSELAVPAHLEQVYDSVEEAGKFLRDSYDKAGWKGMGGWNSSGYILEHYTLPKYKGIVAH